MGSVTTAIVTSWFTTSAARRSEAPSLMRSIRPRGPLLEIADQGRDEPPAGGPHDAEAGVTGLEPLEEGQLDPHRLQLPPDAPGPLQHHPAELRRRGPPPAPDEDRDPELRSNWRICSDTFDCTVCSTSAAAENEPVS